MREYSKILPQFWIGETGRQIAKLGVEARLVALYMLTNVHTNMIGVYYLPIAYIAHDTGVEIEKTEEIIQQLCDIGFCDYDYDFEYIWICNMAYYQIGELKEKDNRVVNVNQIYQSLPRLKFLGDFYYKYYETFHLYPPRKNSTSLQNKIDKPVNNTLLQTPSESENSQTQTIAQDRSATDISSTHEEQQQNYAQKIYPEEYVMADVFSSENMANTLFTQPSIVIKNTTAEKAEKATPDKNITAVVESREIEKLEKIKKDDVTDVFNHWQEVMRHPNAKLDAKRRALINKALKFGYSVDQLCDAISGCGKTPHNIGNNDNAQRYDGLHIILRDADQIDRFIHNNFNPPRKLNKAEQFTQSNLMVAEEWINEKQAQLVQQKGG